MDGFAKGVRGSGFGSTEKKRGSPSLTCLD